MAGATIEQLLGGSDVIGQSIRTEMDLYEVSRTGLPKRALLNLIANLNLSLRSMSSLLNITERTIQRKKEFDLLDRPTSEQVLQIAEVFSRGAEVFGAPENFQLWVNTINKALGNRKPLDLLPSHYGAQMVLDILGRIEHGTIS